MIKGMLAALVVVVAASVAVAEIGQPILIGKGHDPQWSPDETHIAFLQGDNLMVKRLDSPDEARHLYTGPILRYYWLDDSTLAAQERRASVSETGHTLVSKLTRIPMIGPTMVALYDSVDLAKSDARYIRLQRFSNGGVGYFDGSDSPDAIVPLNDLAAAGNQSQKPNLYVASVPGPWGQVWLCYGSGEDRRRITPDDERFIIPRLAPTQDKLYCSDSRGDLEVFDTLGSQLAILSDTDMESWGPAGEYIVYCMTTYGHYDLESSDVWVTRYDGSGTRQVTDTPNIVEFEPSFSPSGSKFIFRNYATGELYIVNFDSTAAEAEK